MNLSSSPTISSLEFVNFIHLNSCQGTVGETQCTASPNLDAYTALKFAVIRLPLILLMGFLAMVVPALYFLEQEEKLSARKQHNASDGTLQAKTSYELNIEDQMTVYPLPFASIFHQYGSNLILESLYIAPLIRWFCTCLFRASEKLSESFIMRAACVPIAARFFVLTLQSRFSSDGKARRCNSN